MKNTARHNKLTVLSGLFIILFLVGTTSCSDSTSAEEEKEMTTEMLIAEVRDVTESYHSFENAQTTGWEVDLSGCVEHPEEGGMGHHFGNPEFIDGRVNHLEPQVLLYEPLKDGGFEFIGVEYIIPFEILSEDSDPPVLFEQEYHQNHELQLWALHVWTEKENPKGIFYDWNPNVSCQYADNEEE